MNKVKFILPTERPSVTSYRPACELITLDLPNSLILILKVKNVDDVNTNWKTNFLCPPKLALLVSAVCAGDILLRAYVRSYCGRTHGRTYAQNAS